MQVTPVSAVPALRTRQKPLETPTRDTENASASNTHFPEMPMVHVASAALRDSYHGAHAEYATQLLASHDAHPQTQVERERYVQHYHSASAYEDDERSYTISLSA